MKESIRGFCSHHPLLVLAIAGASGIAAWHAAAFVVAGAAACWSCAAWWAGRWKWMAAACSVFAAVVVLHALREARTATAERMLLKNEEGAAVGILTTDARGGESRWKGVVKLTSGPAAGAKVWWQGVGPKPVAGTRVEGRGRFTESPTPRNEGAFDEAAWLRNQGVAAVYETGWNKTIQETGTWPHLSARIRHGFRDAVTDGLDPASPEAQVIRAVVVGEMPDDADMLVDHFRRSGSLHVFSVSGLHVVLMAGIGWFVLKWCGVSRRLAIPALLVLVGGYSWITGNSAPAVRAAWMTAVFLGAFAFRRKPDLLNALGAVLLAALLVDGRLIFQPGVQLSYGVVAAIGLGAELANRLFRWMGNPALYVPEELMTRRQRTTLWLRRWIAGTLGVSTAAAVGSAPLTAWHFGMVTPVSIPASLVMVPLVGVLLGGGLFSAAVHPVCPPLSRLLNRANAWVAKGTFESARFFARVPGGNFRTRVELGAALRVYDLPYGAGAACFSCDGSGALIDCGGSGSFRYEVLPSLRALGIAPDSLVLTHPDGHHLGGGARVWEALPLKQVVLPVDEARSPAFREWKNAAPAGLRKVSARTAPVLPLPDGALLELLHAPDPVNLHLIADKRVTIYRLHWRGICILLHGDAGYDAEKSMLRSGADLRADAIIVGHSKEGLSLTDEFLDAVNPHLIIAANPEHPPEEQLPPETAARWRSRGIAVMDQRTAGGVTLRPADGGLECHGYVDGSRFLLTPSGSGDGACVSPPPPTGSGNPSSGKKTNPPPMEAR